MEAQTPKELKEIFEGMAVLLKAYKGIMADGKVNLQDLPVVMALVADSKKLVDAFSGLDLALIEAKSLSEEQAKAIVGELYALSAAVKAA